MLIEIKYSVAPAPSRGFYEAASGLNPDFQYIIIPEGDAWMRNERQKVCGLAHFLGTEIDFIDQFQ